MHFIWSVPVCGVPVSYYAFYFSFISVSAANMNVQPLQILILYSLPINKQLLLLLPGFLKPLAAFWNIQPLKQNELLAAITAHCAQCKISLFKFQYSELCHHEVLLQHVSSTADGGNIVLQKLATMYKTTRWQLKRLQSELSLPWTP
jgi:hypothetical protein